MVAFLAILNNLYSKTKVFNGEHGVCTIVGSGSYYRRVEDSDALNYS